MYVNWKPLFRYGLVFWTLMYATDLLGDSTWKKCSPYIDNILTDQYRILYKMHQENTNETKDNLRIKTKWSMILWNVCTCLCTLFFCSVLKSTSWFLWRLFKIYNIFKNRKIMSNTFLNSKTDVTTVQDANCKVLFKNQMFINSQQEKKMIKEIEDLKNAKNELTEQLLMAKKEIMTARQQIEEYKLETLMMKEKLTRTTDTLKENLKYKDYASANQELIAKKAHSLEIHLNEMSRDRDLLRNKLSNLERSYSKLAEQLKQNEKNKCKTSYSELAPEKDTSETQERESSGLSKGDAGIDKFHKIEWDNESENSKKLDFETNSKISVDLEDSSKENDSEERSNIDTIKRNILNYSAYKAQMLKPRFKLSNLRRMYTSTDTTGSSSDDGGSCHRIISSTAEFQNFLKNLNSKSVEKL